MQNVAIIGATNKEERYARRAQEMLVENQHRVFPVARNSEEILGEQAVTSVDDIKESIDTVTLYVNPKNLTSHVDAIIRKAPQRVIFNPGTEDREIQKTFERAGIETIEACTLVMLRTNQFGLSHEVV